jgi:signal transduction histidine kinase
MSNDQKDLVIGLDGSLRMMEKVLNDVLSFNRMESGNLTQARKPFNLHKAVEYVALSHRSTAELTRLNFQLELDPRIDEVGGALIGDEMRFKQVCSNLVSNAFKFTSSGGVKLVTKLLYPPPHTDTSDGTVVEGGNGTNATSPTVTSEEDRDAEVINALKHAALKSNAQSTAQSKPTSKRVSRISLNNKTRISCDFADEDRPIPETAPAIEETAEADHQPRKVLIRVEVHDTGAGISPTDVRNLFSPYVQTEIGRRQGGKGSGLGLALVSQIVKLSRGRLGVDSELGKGSVFWFEIPYTLSSRPCPPKAEPSWLGTPRRLSSPSPRGSICVTISQGRHRSAPDDPPVRCLGSSPLAQAPLFNVLPFSSPLERDPPTPEEEEPSPMSRPLPLPLAEMSEPGAEADTEDNGDAPTPSCSAQPRPGLIIDLTEPTGPCCPRMNAISRSHQSLLGRTPSLVPYQVPRRTLLATPDPLPILPQYPSPGSDKASPILDFPDPVAAAASASATTDADPTPPESLSVLVVDDDALTRKLMARMLRRLGHSVREAENGQVALNLIVAAAQVEPIDIVFLDK